MPSLLDAPSKRGEVTYCQGSTHANNLNLLAQTEQLRGHKFEQVAPVAVIYHVALVEHNSLELGNGTIIDGGVDQ